MKDKLRSIQALRAIAAALVVSFHALLEVNYRGWSHGVSTYLHGWGALGVDIFFVISGVVVVITTGGRPTGWRSSLAFLHARLTRIVPLYWLFTTIMLLAFLLLPQFFAHRRLDYLNAIGSYCFFPFANRITGSPLPILGVGWTLMYEMWFYTIFSLVLLLPCRFALTAIAAFFSLSAAVGLIGIDNLAFRTYTSPLMLEFVFGCVIGTFYQKGMVLSVRSSGALFTSGAVLLLLSLSLSIGPVVDPAERVIIWGVPSAMFVMGAIFLERAGAWRTNRIIEALGDSSYSLYLGHYPLLFVLIVLAGKLDPGHRTPGDVVWMMFFALACMFGYITHRTVERPIELLLRGRLAIKRATTAPGIAPVS